MIVASAIDVFERKIQILERGGWFADLSRKRKALDRLIPTIRATSDALTRDMYLGRASEVSGVSREMLAREVATVDWGAGDSGYKQVIGAVQGPAMRDWLLVRPGVSAAVARRLAGIWTGSGQRDPAHAPSQPA